MRLGFATTCKGRSEHIKQTLPRNLAANPDALFVLLDYDSPDDLADYIAANHTQDIERGRLTFYRYKNGGAPFHVAHAKNMAARCAMLEGADVLITLDADNFAGAGFADFVAGNLPADSFLCPDFGTIPKPGQPGRPPRGFAGRLAIPTQTFIKAGGYDEFYDTWRGEDMDMIARLDRMGYRRGYFPTEYLDAIPHGSAMRFKEYPHAKQYENPEELDLILDRTETVVNMGGFGLGCVTRNFSHTPITLKALPTRIFGIGLHKTATTSLHEAFKVLGFDSLHWGAGEAPMIWQEMHKLGKSRTVERSYALSDLPIPLLYRELDRAYPGSKFILTIRDEVDWLLSVKRLWDPQYNSTRHLWEVYPISHQLHTALYGQKQFDALLFLQRYRAHNAEVREYFRNRPGDLLVMEHQRWEPLCAFLGCAIPSVAYPKSNGTRHRFNHAGSFE